MASSLSNDKYPARGDDFKGFTVVALSFCADAFWTNAGTQWMVLFIQFAPVHANRLLNLKNRLQTRFLHILSSTTAGNIL